MENLKCPKELYKFNYHCWKSWLLMIRKENRLSISGHLVGVCLFWL